MRFPKDKDNMSNYVLLLNDIPLAIKGQQTNDREYGLMATLPCDVEIMENIDLIALDSVLTEFNLLSYDFHGPWDGNLTALARVELRDIIPKSIRFRLIAMTNPDGKCPYHRESVGDGEVSRRPMTVRDWWPDSLDLRILHQDPVAARPSHVPHPSCTTVAAATAAIIGPSSSAHASYAENFSRLDLDALRNDIHAALTTSHPSWPADYGHYGPLMIRLAWHSAGTYRVFDGRGGGNSGNIRLPPLNSWPDNGNLDKACRYILWPIKRKYGQSISWADLIILAGNVAIESMMGRWGEVQPLWFGGGRVDAFAPEEDIYWGHEPEWLKDDRHAKGKNLDVVLEEPLGAVQMGLIYVNPEGPGGNPDILASAKDIRETFGRMGMNDFETVALIAGGHTFGKAHGAAEASKYVGAEPEGAPINQMGLGWKNSYLSGKGRDTITSGLEGAWTANPTKWDSGYFHLLFKYDWMQSKSPGGATQWVPTMESINANGGPDVVANVPDAHEQGTKHFPIMFTTDLALRYDPIYGPISQLFHLNQDKLTEAFKKAWYKLCHRDMGPISRHLGPYLPKEPLIWLDPIPSADYDIITTDDVQHLQNLVLDAVKQSKVSISDLVKAAWASASTYRCTDHRGGANGGRIRLDPQINWEVNDPVSLANVISFLETLKESFNDYQNQNNRTTRVSFADLIILAGNTAIEEAARKAGHMNVKVPFVAGRADALQSDTDVNSFAALQPSMDGFRNYEGKVGRPEASLIDRAHLMTLTTPEMVVLVGGLRVLNANTDQSLVGVLTDRPGTLDNAYFINLLDENTTWLPLGDGKSFQGNRPMGEPWTASRVDLVLGSNAQLRAVCEAYACADSSQYFLRDFVSSWTKVTMLDRFDLLPTYRANISHRHASKL
ncbi:hypothetical protein ACHAXA_004150 [Cyclostephanos tholiformis]|uniref:Catalase-peroxidase n=1 Tax=Cyclostephanos tholiformis TaxID=382380 RepID=A0ABD3R7F1_9STRA